MILYSRVRRKNITMWFISFPSVCLKEFRDDVYTAMYNFILGCVRHNNYNNDRRTPLLSPIISSVCKNIKNLGVPIILGNFIIPTTKNLGRPVAILPCQRVYLPRRLSVLRSYINKFLISFKNTYLPLYIIIFL